MSGRWFAAAVALLAEVVVAIAEPVALMPVTSASDPLDSAQIRMIVAEAMVDSQARVSQLNSAGNAGHDGRFFTGAADGNFRLQFAGELQFRYYGNFDSDGANGNNDYTGGFQLQRTRLDFRGHVVSPKLTYRVQTNFNRSNGSLELQDAWTEYALDNGLKIRWGQFKLPFDREYATTSSMNQLAIDTSLVNAVFRLDRSQGVQLSYEADRWRIRSAFSDGRRAANTAFSSATEADFALSGRGEIRLGDAEWRQYRDQTAFRGDDFGVLIGGGLHWQQDGSTGAPAGASGTIDLFQYTADIGFEGDGWNLLASIIGRVIDDSDDSFHDWGFVVQGGLFVAEQAEFFGRYAQVLSDNDRPGGTDDFPAITGGVNWYMLPKSHAAKFTAEVTWYPEDQADSSSLISAPNSGFGLLPDSDGGQVVFGAQVQLLF